MSLSRLLFRGVCILCSVFGFGTFILAATRGAVVCLTQVGAVARHVGMKQPHLSKSNPT